MSYRNLIIVLLVDLSVWYSVFTSGTLLPLYLRSNQVPEGFIGFVVGLLSIGAVFSRFGLGWAIDRLGSRKFLLAGSSIWAVTSFAISVNSSLPVLVVCRLLQGAAIGLFTTSAMVYATLSIQTQHRGKVVGLVETFSATAISISPITAVWLSQIGGYQTAFLGAGVVAALGFVGALFLPENPPQPNHGLPIFSKKIEWMTGAALLPGLIGGTFFMAGSAFVGLLPLLGEKYQVANIGLLVSIRGLGTIPSRLSSGFISDHRGYASVLIPGFIMGGVAVFLVPLVSDPISPYLISILFGLGMGFISPTMASWTMSRVSPAIRATAVNNYISLAELAGFFGIWFIGITLETGSLFGFYILGTILVMGFILYIITLKKQPASHHLGE